jgi:hypothetical protein
VAGLRYATGDIAGMTVPAAAAVEGARTAGDPELLAEALVLAGSAAVFRGDLAEADLRLAEAVRLGAEDGIAWAQAHAVMAQGQRWMQAGDLERAAVVLRGAESSARELGSPFTLATVLNVQASLAQVTGDDDRALDRLLEAADLAAVVGTTWTLAYTLPGLAVIAAQRGLPELAAELFAAGSATAEAAAVAVSFPPDLEIAGRWLPEVRSHLGEREFGRAWERGRGLRPADVPGRAALITRRPGHR